MLFCCSRVRNWFEIVAPPFVENPSRLNVYDPPGHVHPFAGKEVHLDDKGACKRRKARQPMNEIAGSNRRNASGRTAERIVGDSGPFVADMLKPSPGLIAIAHPA